MSLLFLMLSNTSCCDKNKDGQTCGANMIYYDDSCGCDANSSFNQGDCTYLAPGVGHLLHNEPNINRSLGVACSDWRDSLLISFGNLNSGAFFTIFGNSDKEIGTSMPSTFSYYEFSQYDSLSFPYFDFRFDYTRSVETAVGIRMNKAHDTMWARIKQVSTMPFTILDTCDVVLTKIK